MPTLQYMRNKCAASPASSSSFWLLRMELAYRHFYGIAAARIGGHKLDKGLHLREDHLATSGPIGPTGLAESSLAPGEGQGRHDRRGGGGEGVELRRCLERRRLVLGHR